MTRLSNLTKRNLLIATHDALATTLAVLASVLSALRGRRLLRSPAAVAAHPALFRRLQRRGLLPLQPDHHEMAFHFAAGRAEHSARRDRADLRAVGAGLHFRRAQPSGQADRAESSDAVLPRQGHHRSLLVSRGVLPERPALCLSLFPLFAHPLPRKDRGSLAGASDRPGGRCRNTSARNRKRRRQASVARRGAVAVARRSRPVDPQYAGARRRRRHRGRDRRFRPAQQADRAGGHDTVGVRAGCPARINSDAGAQAGADRQPPAVAGKRGSAAADGGRGRGSAAASEREYRLRPPRGAGEGQGGHRHRGRRFDRLGDLRARRHLRRVATAGDREFGARALRRHRSAGGASDRRRHRGPDRGYSRSRAHHAADEGIQAGYRVPRRSPQACADSRARLERGGQDQHFRIDQRRRRSACRGRRRDGDDLDRQGDRAGLDARPDQAVCRDVLPGARS